MPHFHRQNGHGRFSVRALWRAGAGLLCLLAPVYAETDMRQKELEEWRIACATGEGEACYALGDAYEIRKDLWGLPVKPHTTCLEACAVRPAKRPSMCSAWRCSWRGW